MSPHISAEIPTAQQKEPTDRIIYNSLPKMIVINSNSMNKIPAVKLYQPIISQTCTCPVAELANQLSPGKMYNHPSNLKFVHN